MPDSAIRLLSVGTALPGSPVDNAELARHFGMGAAWEQWIDTFIGTRTRHFAFDLGTGEIHRTLTDLGEEAGRRALAAADLAPTDVDLVVMGTSSPDLLMPATVNVIADRLGIDDVASYQLQSGCSGAVQALDVANQMLLTGRFGTALVIGGDTCAKHYDVRLDPRRMEPGHMVNIVLFGDGAGAAVLSREPVAGAAAAGAPVVRHVRVRLCGLNRPPGQIVEWFGAADRDSDRPPVVEDYRAIQESVPLLAGAAYQDLLDDLDWKPTDVDYLLPPQLSGAMTGPIAAELDAPDAQPISCVAEIGNTGNALPFFQLERLLPRMTAGDRAVAVAIESSKWIKAAFAVEKV
jgi:3-oxoacyl-[acyl-carrier-protein] synthase-3